MNFHTKAFIPLLLGLASLATVHDFMKHLMVMLMSVGIAVSGGCVKGPRVYTDGVERSAMNLQQEYECRTAELDARSKSTPRQMLAFMQQLLDGVEDEVRQRELARLTSQPTNSQFDDLLAGAFVERLLKSGDVGYLKHLLGTKCPEYIGAMPLEFVLATSKQADAILLLSQAYSTAATNATAEVVLRCLNRAFPVLKQSAQSDKAFVAACESWWVENRMRCAINFEYPHLPGRLAPAPEQSTAPAQSGLFLLTE
jgi:hypothetical protein